MTHVLAAEGGYQQFTLHGSEWVILIGSGAVFVALTALIWRWATRIRDQFAPQDDLVQGSAISDSNSGK